MSYWTYSTEALPRTDLFAKRDYNPAADYVSYNGVYFDPIPAKTWTKLQERFKSLRHVDRTDKRGHEYNVFADEIVKANQDRLAPRGVIFLDHEPSADEKTKLEAESLKRNLEFRLEAIQHFEDQVREHDTGNPARTKPTTYELECYEILGMERPGSVNAVRGQRQPGEAAAERFAAAIEKLLARLTPTAPETKGPAKVS